MKTKTLGKAIGGAAIYKIQDHYLPFTHPMFGMDLAKLGLGVGEVALAVFGERKLQGGVGADILGAVGIGGAVQIVSEIAKVALASSPQTLSFNPQVLSVHSPEALVPTSSLVKVD